MKKKILFLSMLFGLILIPKGVLAASLGLSCPTSVTVGESITCTLTANHETISGVKGSLTFSGMSYQSVSNLTGSNYFSVSSSGFDGAIDIASGSKSLAKYVFTTSSVGTATINVSCSELVDGTNFDTHSCSGASKTITIKAKPQPTPQPSNPTPSTPTPSNPAPQQPQQPQKSTNNNLKSLSIDGFELVKVDNNNYTLTVPNNVTSINVNATAEDSKAKVTGIGAKELVVGENNIEVIVTSESGAQNKINVKVTRKDGYYLDDLDLILNDEKIQDADIIISNDSKLSKEQINKIKNSKKTLRFNYYDNNKKLVYSWTIDGKLIKNASELITTITYTSDNAKEIYRLSNYADGLYFNFNHTGDLPTGTKVKLYVGDKFENENKINVYQYNKSKKSLELVKKNLEVTDGYIEFSIEKSMEYFVTMSVIGKSCEEESDINIFKILIYILLIIIGGLLLFIITRSKKAKKEISSSKDSQSAIMNNSQAEIKEVVSVPNNISEKVVSVPNNISEEVVSVPNNISEEVLKSETNK